MDNYCRCFKCNSVFRNDSDYEDHSCGDSSSDSDTDTEIMIPTSEDGEYICPICENRYITGNLLGEHFILNHNDYSELSRLDELQVSTGFPGFALLEYIGMIQKIELSNYLNNTCPICYGIFKDSEPDYDEYSDEYMDIEYANINKIRGYYSDSESILRNRRPCIVASELSDHRIICAYNKLRRIRRLPVSITCCNSIICYSCLESHLTITNNIMCPFCRKDHTVEDKEYIVEIVCSDTTDREKWIPWWLKHLDIFD